MSNKLDDAAYCLSNPGKAALRDVRTYDKVHAWCQMPPKSDAGTSLRTLVMLAEEKLPEGDRRIPRAFLIEGLSLKITNSLDRIRLPPLVYTPADLPTWYGFTGLAVPTYEHTHDCLGDATCGVEGHEGPAELILHGVLVTFSGTADSWLTYSMNGVFREPILLEEASELITITRRLLTIAGLAVRMADKPTAYPMSRTERAAVRSASMTVNPFIIDGKHVAEVVRELKTPLKLRVRRGPLPLDGEYRKALEDFGYTVTVRPDQGTTVLLCRADKAMPKKDEWIAIKDMGDE